MKNIQTDLPVSINRHRCEGTPVGGAWYEGWFAQRNGTAVTDGPKDERGMLWIAGWQEAQRTRDVKG